MCTTTFHEPRVRAEAMLDEQGTKHARNATKRHRTVLVGDCKCVESVQATERAQCGVTAGGVTDSVCVWAKWVCVQSDAGSQTTSKRVRR